MKRVIEYLPALTVVLLYLGLSYLYYYYLQFNVDIFSFISTTDIILSFFPKIVVFSTVVYGTVFWLISSALTKRSELPPSDQLLAAQKRRREWLHKNFQYVIIGIVMLNLVTLAIGEFI